LRGRVPVIDIQVRYTEQWHILPALFVSLVLLLAAAKKKMKKKCLGKCGTSSGHITKLEQSILFRYLWFESEISLFGQH
jgi:hypothetical protein